MSKFKVGDKVKLNTIEHICDFAPKLKVGDIGTVNSISISGIYIVLFNEDDDQQWAFDTFELELVTGEDHIG